MKGWEPAEVTTYEYDGDRLVRSVTVRESEYDGEQVALLLASRRISADVGPHGIPMSEATAADGRGKFEGFPVPRIDWAEFARQHAKDHYYAQYPDADRAGHLWGVRRVDPRS